MKGSSSGGSYEKNENAQGQSMNLFGSADNTNTNSNNYMESNFAKAALAVAPNAAVSLMQRQPQQSDRKNRCEHCGGAMMSDPVHGQLICKSCGNTIENNIVSDVVYTEGSGGAVRVSGMFIKNNQGSSSSFDASIRQMNTSLREVANKVGNIGDSTIGMAERMYLLAYRKGFVRGRKRSHLAAALLYIASRSQLKSTNAHLMIDFADAVGLSIPALRRIVVAYASEFKVVMPVADPSTYMYRFMSALELNDPELEKHVMKTGLKLLSRSMSDNLHLGRRPTGLVAAALFVACRICGRPRPKRDFVELMFIHEGTLNKRLEELASLPVASMTVNEFESHSDEQLNEKFKDEGYLPPSLQAGLEAGKKVNNLPELKQQLSNKGKRSLLGQQQSSTKGLDQLDENAFSSSVTERNRFEQEEAFRSAEVQYDMVSLATNALEIQQPTITEGKDGSQQEGKGGLADDPKKLLINNQQANDNIVNRKADECTELALKYLYSEAQQKTVEQTWDLQYAEKYQNLKATQQVNESSKYSDSKKHKLKTKVSKAVNEAVSSFNEGTYNSEALSMGSGITSTGTNINVDSLLQGLQSSSGVLALIRKNLSPRMFSYGGGASSSSKEDQTKALTSAQMEAISQTLAENRMQNEQKEKEKEKEKDTEQEVQEEYEEQFEYEYNYEPTNNFMYN